MLYDVFILSLALIGIVGVLVFSYKITHSSVYPVGVLEKSSLHNESINKDEAELRRVGLSESDWLTWRNVAKTSIDIENAFQSEWERDKCSVYEFTMPTGIRLNTTRGDKLRQEPTRETEQSKIEREVAEQKKALKAIENRVRQLELDSVQKSQEAGEEAVEQPHLIN